jgi:hypothetical protein
MLIKAAQFLPGDTRIKSGHDGKNVERELAVFT